ncbi:MAG: IS3 family transposase, partial [Planctomycetota bacterium]
LMRLIDQEHLEHPARGSRQVVDHLTSLGWKVNRRRIQRWMRKMGVAAIAPKPQTTVSAPGHRVYPYLLLGLAIERPNQVWRSDTTYVPMACGLMHLVAVMDWFSRRVLSWKLSNSMDADFCIEAVKEALDRATPEIMNTDQGSQFTSREFTQCLREKGVTISMDGRGRAIDNVMIERLWRTVKDEEIYVKEYQSVTDLREGLRSYFDLYGQRRKHSSLGRQTTAEVYRNGRPEALRALSY